MDLGIGMGIDTTDFGFFNPFQFTFEASSPLPSSESESGGSTGSFSPPPSMCAASVDTGYSASTDNPAAELANRVRKNTSLILAVQIGGESQYQPHQPSVFTARLPPRIQRPTPLHPHLCTTAPVAPSALPMPATQSRPKTSHTTIECRYRTNFNAHIQSLRQVVPALRVVDRAAAIKAGEPYPGGGSSDPEDHIDNSIKIARKCSKANVLGKAVKYIRMFKNPKKHLMCELEGLKSLLRWLVEGTALVGSGSVSGGVWWGERDEVGVEDGDRGMRTRMMRGGWGGGDRRRGCLPYATCTSSASVGAGLVGNGKEVPSPSLSFPPSFPMLSFPSFPTLLFPSDPPPSRHCRTPTPSSRALHGGCICRMHALRAALVPISLVFTLTLPPPYYLPCSPPSSRVQPALGSDAAHAHTHVYVESPRSSPSPFSPPFPLFPTAPVCAVESSADCTKLDSAVVQLRTHMPCVCTR
ncbi:hypothetical protein B0H16DRAFT_1473510 [Mycena metata]|uniref:BHLH domain-containing protein n=1 Tax=Mycena metata TaxID=1033252 RepID=A0AAD7HK23_9AGAR|nr:hypothetical protein B0H16DRAFT_1473510 [Mycena metata]